jgi:phosphoglycolate phosphatase
VTPPETILFDLDGTLIDSFEGLTRCYAHALSSLGRVPPPPEGLRDCIGPPIRRNFARLLGSEDPALLESAVHHFRERYASVGWTECHLYAGVLEMVDGVRALGARVYVATAKPQTFADRILARLGLTERIDGAFGPPLDGSMDDKRILLGHALRTASIDAASAALVGDRDNDVRAALAHGVLPVGVTWGFGSREELVLAGAALVLDSPPDVVARLGRG